VNTDQSSVAAAWHEACGCIHLHTRFSDGTSDMDTLVRTAAVLGLQYVVVTDHMTLRAAHEGWQGWHDGVLVDVGYEHHDSSLKHHYLVLGLNEVLSEHDSPQRYVNQVRERNGIGFIAHPFEKRDYFSGLPAYPWTDWAVQGFDGLEIWNQMSEWVEGLRGWYSIVKFMYPRRFLAGPPPELLRKWDELNARQLTAGIGGVDAHTHRLRWGPFSYTIFPLKVELKGIRTHVFTEQPLVHLNAEEAQKQLHAALAFGHCFVSNYRRGDARGSRMFLRDARGQLHPPGRSAKPVSGSAQLEISLPERADIRVMRDGAEVQRLRGSGVTADATADGVYRLEVYRRGKLWMLSNPWLKLSS
jgi:hypothetical protein